MYSTEEAIARQGAIPIVAWMFPELQATEHQRERQCSGGGHAHETNGLLRIRGE